MQSFSPQYLIGAYKRNQSLLHHKTNLRIEQNDCRQNCAFSSVPKSAGNDGSMVSGQMSLQWQPNDCLMIWAMRHSQHVSNDGNSLTFACNFVKCHFLSEQRMKRSHLTASVCGQTVSIGTAFSRRHKAIIK